MMDRLGEVLVEVGVITPDQLAAANAAMRNGADDNSLADVLIKKGFATEAQIIKGIGVKDQIPYFEDIENLIAPEALPLVPETYCRKYQLVPLFLQDQQLFIAMINPYDLVAIDELHRITGKVIQPVLSSRRVVFNAISKLFLTRDSIQSTISRAETEMEAMTSPADAASTKAVVRGFDQAAGDEADAEDAPVIKLVNQIMKDAVMKKASDIHVESRVDSLVVRYRLDGVLQNVMTLPHTLCNAVISRIKIMSRLDIAETRKPQDGRATISLGGRRVDMRVSTLPLVSGEKAVMRILDHDNKPQDIDNIGLPPDVLRMFRRAVESPNGIVLVTGPTGSGKTTTLYAALNAIKDESINIATLEDPVEYQVEGINQVAVNVKTGLTFANGLRAMLRQDPDVLLVGEIRDQETAEIAVQASLTGHLVLSTLHTNSAPGAISRLLDMNVEPFLLGTALKGVLAQRLVRMLCPKCKSPYAPDATVLGRLKLEPGQAPESIYRPGGCKDCTQTGYSGRGGIFEFLPVSEEIRERMFARATDDQIAAAARAFGYRTMFEHGRDRILRGETSVEEVLRVVRAE